MPRQAYRVSAPSGDDKQTTAGIGGRGSSHNPVNRFESLALVPDGVPAGPATRFLKDTSRSIISYNDSPDVGFDASVNPYRGCEQRLHLLLRAAHS